jgi:hypothetical protein
MLPDSPVITLIFLIGHAILGDAIGAVSGWLTYAVTKTGTRRLPTNALIGMLGYFAGFSTCFLPWHQNTISYRLSGGTLVTSTANYFQYYGRIAVIVAVTLPCLYELSRFLRARRSTAR